MKLLIMENSLSIYQFQESILLLLERNISKAIYMRYCG